MLKKIHHYYHEKYNVDLVVEGTGRFVTLEGASKHIDAGAKKVLITAPAKSGDVKTIVYSVNHNILTKDDKVVSGASCTTNCLAPVMNVLENIQLNMVLTGYCINSIICKRAST